MFGLRLDRSRRLGTTDQGRREAVRFREGHVIAAWDGASLTLFALLYAIVVTVTGVVVAMLFDASKLAAALYGGTSLLGLVLFFGVAPQWTIRVMRAALEHALRKGESK